MTARILVVDDVLANVKLMEARLSAEYFDVVTALSGGEALAACERGQCDIEHPAREAIADAGKGGRLLVVDDRKASYERMQAMLADEHQVEVEPDPSGALFRVAEGGYDIVVVSLGLENFDGLRLCSQVRSLERTRNVPILAVAEPEDSGRLMRGL